MTNQRISLRRVFAVFGLFFLCAAPPVHATRYALLVGLNLYDAAYGAGTLHACVNDANGIRNCLLADTVRWQSANVTRLLNSAATKTSIRSSLTSLAATAVPGDVVLYFHSSHGGQNSETSVYLCSHDDDYEDTELAADLTQFRDGVTVIIVLDTCFSGGMFLAEDGLTPPAPTWDFARSVMRHCDAIRKGRAIKGASIGWITACDFDEYSMEGGCYGLFTGNLVSGLVHGDTTADGVLTFQELFDYAAPRTLLAEPTQTPQTLNESVLSATECAAVLPFDSSLQDAVDTTLSVCTTPGPGALWYRQTAVRHDTTDAARSGLVSHGQGSAFEIRVVGPGILSFYWQVSSELGYDFLSCHVDNMLFDEISGTTTWAQRIYRLGPGAHVLRWAYQKDESDTGVTGSNCGWVDQVAWTPISGVVWSELAEALDAPTLTFLRGGYQPWARQTGVTHDHVDAAQSGTCIDGQSSWCTTTVTGPGSLSFWWRVSSEEGYDVLDFTLDDDTKARISGEVDWQWNTFSIPAGTHTVGWSYAKDVSDLASLDRGWVDQVVWAPSAGPEMDLQGNSQSIAAGDSTPSATDHTDFGYALADGRTVVRTFTIRNTGNGELHLSGNPPVTVAGTHAAEFTVTTQPSTPVAAAGTTTFQVTFDPAETGARGATLSIASDDDDESPYHFAVRGVGTIPPELETLELLDSDIVVLRWSSITNHVYTIHHSTNLQTGFSILQEGVPARPPVNTYTDTLHGVRMKLWNVTTDE